MALRAFLVGLLALLSWPALAHEGRPLYVEVTAATGGQYELRWKVPPVLAAGDEPFVFLRGESCRRLAGQEAGALVGNGLYACGETAVMPVVKVSYPSANPVLSTLVHYIDADGASHSILMGPDESVIPLPVAASRGEVMVAYTASGVEHILVGYDHLLFLVCLILIARTPRRVLVTVTGFTLGHSLTLAMAALGHWSLYPPLVEALIAFSIVVLATEVWRGDRGTLAWRYPAFVASGFGLLHGFGFAGALKDFGLPETMELTALAFFNVGVEIGQIAFVVAAFAAFEVMGWAERRAGVSLRGAVALERALLVPVGWISAYWAVERTVGMFST